MDAIYQFAKNFANIKYEDLPAGVAKESPGEDPPQEKAEAALEVAQEEQEEFVV